MKRLLLLSLLVSTCSFAEGPFGKTFIQCFVQSSFMNLSHKEVCWEKGRASYHFVNETLVYINWKEMGLSYLNGEPAHTSTFENTNFDLSTRTFSGSIIFNQQLHPNQLRWDYVMKFNKSFSTIKSGYGKVIFEDGTVETRRFNHKNPSTGEREDNWWYVLAEY